MTLAIQGNVEVLKKDDGSAVFPVTVTEAIKDSGTDKTLKQAIDEFKAGVIADINAKMVESAQYAQFKINSPASIASAINQKLSLNVQEDFNGQGFCRLNNGSIEFLENGLYEIIASVAFTANAVGQRSLRVGDVVTRVNAVEAAGTATYLAASTFMNQNASSTFTLFVDQISGNPLDVAVSGTIVKVRKIASL